MREKAILFVSLIFVVLGSNSAFAADGSIACSAKCGFSYTYVPCVIMGGRDCERYNTLGISSEGPTMRDSYRKLVTNCQDIGNNYNQTNNTHYNFQLFDYRNGSYFELDNSEESMNKVCL